MVNISHTIVANPIPNTRWMVRDNNFFVAPLKVFVARSAIIEQGSPYTRTMKNTTKLVRALV